MHAILNHRTAVAMALSLVALLPLPSAAHCGHCDKKAEAPCESKSAVPNVVQAAIAAGQFTTLVKALEAAGLVSALEGEGPFTVFAPTDEAFAKLPAGTLESLLQDKEKLTKVLTYHVVPGKVTSAEVVKLHSAKTLQGQSLRIDASEGVRVGGANVVKADVAASNGVIHVIDTVLIPQ